MAWTPKLTQLNDVLGELVPNHESITKFIRDAELKPQMISFQGSALDIWSNVLSEADKNGKVNNLVQAVLVKYPENPYLKTALETRQINYSLSPDLDKISEWKGVEEETLEVLTLGYNTLLPISFLEKGIKSSRSVAKVEIKQGSTTNVGTGFLFKISGIEDLFFMTNFHVINDPSKVEYARIIFNYEEDVDGNSKASKSFKIDEALPWYLSPVKELDISVFKIRASAQELAEFGYLTLRKVETSKNDFVNIIQHPGGQMKQISLYHNIVTNTTKREVQYLTDTLKGSSGAPVFNSNWEVVALHHSGGSKKENEGTLPQQAKYRNEGIQINEIIDFISAQHLK